MDMKLIPLTLNIMLESNPPKSRILVRRLAVPAVRRAGLHRPADLALHLLAQLPCEDLAAPSARPIAG